MSSSTRLITRSRSVSGRVLAGVAASALVLGGAVATVAPPSAMAAEDADSDEPTVAEVAFVAGTVLPTYTQGDAVPEQVGDQQQIEAILGDENAEAGPHSLEDQANRAVQTEVDVNLVRADLEADNALIAVTWDPSVTAPEAIDLRYLLDGTWSAWTPLEVADAPDDSDVEAAVAGTEPFSVFFAKAVEVVARGEDGQSIPGLTLVVIDAESGGQVDNALADLTPENGVEEVPEGPDEAETAHDEAGDEVGTEDQDEEDEPGSEDPLLPESGDQLVDLEGAALGDGAGFEGVPSALASVLPAALNSAGTVFDTGYQGLKINTRKAWGADESLMTWTPKANSIKGAVVHHTESSNNYTQAQVAQQIRNIYEYHAVKLNWGDIGYNVIVDKFGGVWEGRAGGLTKMIHAAHAGNANSATFGISVMGGFMDQAPIAATQDAVAKTIAWKLQLHGINSISGNISVLHESGKHVSVPVVSAHRDVGWTDCPGDAFYQQMGNIRTKAANYMAATTTPGVGGGSEPGSSTGSATSGLPASFNAANVIGDTLFYDSSAMTEAQIKSLIQSVGKDCKPGSGTTCLKDTVFPTKNLTTLRGGCKPLTMSGNQAPWTIVSKTAQACGINPQVLLTTLQKEQSGLTQPKSADTWAKAMGSGCPDNSGCDASQGGFQKQVYYGADKLVSYRLQSQAGHVDAFKAGRSVTVQHNPNAACGSQSLKFANVATASLYEYTPYIGNSSVAGCGATGQKNFYDIYKRYFPETVGAVSALKAPTPTISGVPLAGTPLTVTGAAAANFTPAASAVTYQWLRSGVAISGATAASYTPTSADVGKVLTVKVTGTKSGYESGVGTSKALTIRGGVERLGGANRIATNIAVNNATMKAGKPLFLVTSADYADALTVGPAVAASGGSLMLTNPAKLDAQNIALIKSRKPSQIYVVGGEGAVSEGVFEQAKAAAPGISMTRIFGDNRYDTSLAIANHFFGAKTVKNAFIVTGRDYADALSTSAVAGGLGAPLLLVDGQATRVSAATSAFLQSKKPSALVIAGGPGVISESIESSLRSAHAGTVRVFGDDRYQTNLALNNYLTKNGGSSPTTIWISTGGDFPDALSAAVPAGAKNQNLILARSSCIPKPVVSTVISGATSKVTSVKVVGGTGVLSKSVAELKECQ